jgi:hypothetical protein
LATSLPELILKLSSEAIDSYGCRCRAGSGFRRRRRRRTNNSQPAGRSAGHEFPQAVERHVIDHVGSYGSQLSTILKMLDLLNRHVELTGFDRATRTCWMTSMTLYGSDCLVFFIKKRLDPDSFRKSPPERSGIDYRLSKVWIIIERGVFLARYSPPPY